jgi:hypothetical protein
MANSARRRRRHISASADPTPRPISAEPSLRSAFHFVRIEKVFAARKSERVSTTPLEQHRSLGDSIM